MVNLPKNKCCACSACFNVCPHGAISMQEDNYGYVYPKINLNKCIACGLCDQACPELHIPKLNKPEITLAAVCRNKKEFSTTSSGGVATTISRYIIAHGGIVYGCCLNNYRDIRHIRVDSLSELDLLKRSKYVQSTINLIFRDVKKDLLADRNVLFIGTPCQVGGLRQFLKKSYSKLLTIDLVCHGVPSIQMLTNEVDSQINRNNFRDEDIYVDFRWKEQTGIQFGIQFGVKKRGIIKMIKIPYDPYMAAFLSGLSYRENCHNCSYAQEYRVSDITIGDFWGLGKEVPSAMNCEKGVSLILVNTEKGELIMKAVKDDFDIEVHTFEEAVKENWNLHSPSVRPQNKDHFLRLYKERGLKGAALMCDPMFRYENKLIRKLFRKCAGYAVKYRFTHVLGKKLLGIYRTLKS